LGKGERGQTFTSVKKGQKRSEPGGERARRSGKSPRNPKKEEDLPQLFPAGGSVVQT